MTTNLVERATVSTSLRQGPGNQLSPTPDGNCRPEYVIKPILAVYQSANSAARRPGHSAHRPLEGGALC